MVSLNISSNVFETLSNDLNDEEKSLLRDILKRKEQLLNEIKALKDELLEIQIEMEDLEERGAERANSKDSELRKLRNRFNAEPKKGIRELIVAEYLDDDPSSIAEFLFRTEGLSKKAVGEYLGVADHVATLKAFTALHNLAGIDLLESLRRFLGSFFLPGEAQVIERILMAFSEHYYLQQATGTFESADVVYFLCMAVITLNVHIHNPAARRSAGSITLEKWIEMARSGEDCSTLDETFLRDLYMSIKRQEFEIPTEDGSDLFNTFSSTRKGWLHKQGGRVRNWKRRYFVLADQSLLYFENSSDKDPKGMIPLQNVAVREIQDRAKSYCFEIFSTNAETIKAWKQGTDKVTQMGNHMVYKMSASNKEEMADWIKKIREQISESAFEEMINVHRGRRLHEHKT